jgi:hypothetical protein
MREMIDTAAKYVIALVVVVGCLVLIYQSRGDPVQPWTIMGLIIGWIIRDSAGNSSSANLARLAASQPTVTTAGNPPSTTVSPSEPPA